MPETPHSVVIHAHFYQPPREEPWLDLLEREPSAAPYHDWNARIERECYRAVVAARTQAPDGYLGRLLNTLEWISFNVGPTLLEWMETAAPNTYNQILAADRASVGRLGGHGNAIAMPYHHTILPLASRRDKVTEVRWGKKDFRRRFGREAEGMWLPETAADEETLEVLAAEGIRYTVLAPHQVRKIPPRGQPGWWNAGGGRRIALFLYDGPISHDVAFGPLVKNSDTWVSRVLAAANGESVSPGSHHLTAIATDGETYGHHHHFGEMALAAAIQRFRASPGVRVENFASVLARSQPTDSLDLLAPSSWSCSHGVERWRSDCGCKMAPHTESSQAWRAPLREALNWLAEKLHAQFELEGSALLGDPWTARDAYAGKNSTATLPPRARELLEMERNALRMFTSCGWFFDDIAGIESLQCLRYAARGIDFAGSDSPQLRQEFARRLSVARSNDPAEGTGADLLITKVLPTHPPEVRAAAAAVAMHRYVPSVPVLAIGSFDVDHISPEEVHLIHARTGRRSVLRVSLRRGSVEGFSAEVIPADGNPCTVRFHELPEPEREQIRHATREELLYTLFTEEERHRLVTGVVTYQQAVGDLFLRFLPAEPALAKGLDLDRLVRVLDLFALEEAPIPFDAQTRFYRLLQQGPTDIAHSLRGLAPRFGFSAASLPPEPSA